MAVFAAPAVSTWNQELDEATNDLVARGFSEADILEAHAALDTMFRVVGTGEGVEDLRKLFPKQTTVFYSRQKPATFRAPLRGTSRRC